MAPPEAESEYPIEQQVQSDREKAHQHRSLAPVECVKRVDQHLQRRIPREPDRIEAQRTRRLRGLVRGEFSVLIKH